MTHPISRSRRDVLEFLRSVKKSVRKLRDKLRKKGDLDNRTRHELYGMTESILGRVEQAIRALDAERPERHKSSTRKKPRPPLRYFGLGDRD